jgi:multidrug efflux system outer membrane protein
MIGVTLLGLFLTPVFYYVLMRKKRSTSLAPKPAPAAVAHAMVLLLAALGATSCIHPIGPDYRRPELVVPAQFRDADIPAGDLGEWKEGEPRAAMARGAWWEMFGDPVLDELEGRAAAFNQDLLAAVARVEQARSRVVAARGGLLPTVTFDPSLTRERSSGNQTFRFPELYATTLSLPVNASYEIDLFGRLRRGLEATERDSEAVLADFEAVRLSLHADVASTYFALRATDQELAALRGALQLRREAVDLARARRDGGTGNDLDVARAETEAARTAADLAAGERQRSELANALGVLVGEPASTFDLASGPELAPEPPDLPPGLPSDLLERRPDVAAAERQLAALNARIGLAQIAFFPVLSLTGFAGYASAELSTLFDTDSQIWSIGPSLTLPIFNGGRNTANLRAAEAAYTEGVARYRQSVLVAFREVQDALTARRLLRDQALAQSQAVVAAERAASLARRRFDAGLVSYLEGVDSERQALDLERERARLDGDRFVVAVQLVRALGGGWSSEALPELASEDGAATDR